MVLTSVRVKVPASRRGEILKTLGSILEPTRVLPGCLSCCLYQDLEDTNTLILIENWDSREALEKHVRSDRYRKILAAMDLACEPPEVRFCGIASIEGMEHIEEIRG